MNTEFPTGRIMSSKSCVRFEGSETCIALFMTIFDRLLEVRFSTYNDNLRFYYIKRFWNESDYDPKYFLFEDYFLDKDLKFIEFYNVISNKGDIQSITLGVSEEFHFTTYYYLPLASPTIYYRSKKLLWSFHDSVPTIELPKFLKKVSLFTYVKHFINKEMNGNGNFKSQGL